MTLNSTLARPSTLTLTLITDGGGRGGCFRQRVMPDVAWVRARARVRWLKGSKGRVRVRG